MTDGIIYSDIDMDFVQTDEGDTPVLVNIESVKQSIKNIILTPIGSRSIYQDPDYGSNVSTLLFEKTSSLVALLLREEIENAIDNFEPRVEVIDVSVEDNSQTNTYEILIKYRVLAVNIEDDLTLDLEVLK